MDIKRRTVLGGLAAAVTTAQATGSAQSAESASFRSEGRNPDGTTYTGTARVTVQGTSVSITWVMGGQTFQGKGLRDGRVIAVDWGQADPVVYVVMPDGEFHGTWADGTALDKLIPA